MRKLELGIVIPLDTVIVSDIKRHLRAYLLSDHDISPDDLMVGPCDLIEWDCTLSDAIDYVCTGLDNYLQTKDSKTAANALRVLGVILPILGVDNC